MSGSQGDRSLVGKPVLSEAEQQMLEPGNEWAIPTTVETPDPSPRYADIAEASTTHNRGNHVDTISGELKQRQVSGLAQREKRGSSETRNKRRSLVVEQTVLQQGNPAGLQELRNEIDIIKAGRRDGSSLFTNGLQLGQSNDETSPDPVVQTKMALPSPPPSVVNTSPSLPPLDDEYEPLEIRSTRGPGVKKGNDGARIRASSSALEFGAPLHSKPLPEHINKGRTMQDSARSSSTSRIQSTPSYRRKASSGKISGSGAAPPRHNRDLPTPKMDRSFSKANTLYEARPPSPIPDIMPLPPFTMPTFLQLELSSQRPSPLYMYRPSSTEYPYEPTSIKAERLLNFLLLPPQLERVLWFGTIACVDAWLYNFTILPIRFCLALAKLIRSMARNLWSEVKFLTEFIPLGLNRMWQRQVGHSEPPTPTPDPDSNARGRTQHFPFPQEGNVRGSHQLPRLSRPKLRRHKRTRSVASTLMSAEKADLLKGLLIVMATVILMRFDASMMYHSIRGQAAIKLYVIYNVLEVFDRLFSAIGQDILECLFSTESLSRHPNGRSKILRPLSLFPLALIYVVIHATALYYQVITLNVAVNSYSNALLTLLMSNQFVEIKSTVFKRIEKENLFQMTCADVVERFQLWLMLMIIAGRNIIETSASAGLSASSGATPLPLQPPPSSPTLLPFSFTLFPSLSFSQILNPFILVLGTETLVDWLKHAYITKFNNVKPNLYGRFLDVLAKDYYGHAFADPNLTRRIGLPVLPLTCLATRAAVQTYHMARDQLVPQHVIIPSSSSNSHTGFNSSLAFGARTTAGALRHIDEFLLKMIGAQQGPSPTSTSISVSESLKANATAAAAAAAAVFSTAASPTASVSSQPVPAWWLPSSLAARLLPAWMDIDTITSVGTGIALAMAIWLVLLAAKLVLGMLLLGYARQRYARMKAREEQPSQHHDPAYQEGRRSGGWGTVEIDEDKRRWIYVDDAERLRKLRERDIANREREGFGPNFGQMSTSKTGASTSAGVGASAGVGVGTGEGGISGTTTTPSSVKTKRAADKEVDEDNKDPGEKSVALSPNLPMPTLTPTPTTTTNGMNGMNSTNIPSNAATSTNTSTSAGTSTGKKTPNYESVERYRLGGSKRIW